MAAASAPYGLRPVGKLGGRMDTAGIGLEVAMTANSATGIFFGDMVNIAAGAPTAVGTTPTTTKDTNTPVGVFIGCRYVDLNGRQQEAQSLPANAVTNGYKSIFLKINDDPDTVYMIQADGAVTKASIGLNAPVGGFGNNALGDSTVKLLSGSIASTITLALRIIGLVDNGGSSIPGDAFTDCLVVFNQGVHAYRNGTGG